MKFFIAQIATETNTFASTPTGQGAFEEYGIFRGDASTRAPDTTGYGLAQLRALIERDGHEVVESVCAFAQPSGPTVRAVFEALRDALLSDLRDAMPVDAVQLMLHGAMVADGIDDCEGDLLTRIRELVGPGVPIGVELDLHCHLTAAMLRAATAIVAYKSYPHTDLVERAAELYRIVADTVRGAVVPVTAVVDCRMVGVWPTTREPMRSFVRRMQEAEAIDGVLSVSLGHGFPWGDVPEAGAKLWVVADGDAELARRVARMLAREFWDLREHARLDTVPVDEALDLALATAGTVVLADMADNPGAGAPGDSTFVLRRLLERRISRVAIGAFWDVGAVRICQDAGVGARLDLRVGGKCGPASGDPVDLRVTVRAVVEGHSQRAMGGRTPLGTSVWVEADGGLHLLLVSVRSQVFATDAFTGVGIDPSAQRLVVVKSMQHFHAEFALIAARVLYVAGPGAVTPDFAGIDYRRRDLDYWPRVASPGGGEGPVDLESVSGRD
ncbi:M81 family metallopeptidase [Mitsuaria sp. GD03876]|uniref:M81 family metallopeptidase n=1 Tax=Mitsuaria sp. GD03876 TaxID=2975399 RepID=UPI002446CAB1|nr:M81 family metallopeptidase [Mitsuaria sp. GD03876]MDH0868285.1 M81 family metallopeptidase [Mitsuaria sp. GD03876]